MLIIKMQVPVRFGDRDRDAEIKIKNHKLIIEAIKRILLDIIVRGHGLRLIGRWSSELEIQKFLERVPYLLDRINQLHLTCERNDNQEQQHTHAHHHRHQIKTNSLHDFVQLIGTEHHWLVRTRDTLGLTPIHKAVLHQNRPIVEFVLDRYPDELACSSSSSFGAATSGSLKKNEDDSKLAQSERSSSSSSSHSSSMNLIDAQDKFGRTALHYAAGLVENDASNPNHLYKFLLRKGALRRIADFRGKTADYYSRHPSELKSKCIMHLANKRNAQYQASILSRTLRFAKCSMEPLNHLSTVSSNEDLEEFGGEDESEHQANSMKQKSSMSVSCANLHAVTKASHRSQQTGKPSVVSPSSGSSGSRGSASKLSPRVANRSNSCTELTDINQSDFLLDQLIQMTNSREQENVRGQVDEQATINLSADSLCSSPAPLSSDNQAKTVARKARAEAQLKRLVSERCDRIILNDKTRQSILRSLKDGHIDSVQELMLKGFGRELVELASHACWNVECRRYINKIVVKLLDQVDRLHELIAKNSLTEFKQLLELEPILARIKRPYKRAAMNGLHLAVYFNRKSMLSHLLGQYPEMVTKRDSTGATCLHLAAKSLHCDRIYCWLSEHFGPQLEQLRDTRNKSASDYRQQAIRLASFEQNHDIDTRGQSSPVKNPVKQIVRQDDVREILRQKQVRENNLRLEGTQSRLLQREVRPRQIDIGTTSRVKLSSTRDDKRAEIGVESAAPTHVQDASIARKEDANELRHGESSPPLVEASKETELATRNTQEEEEKNKAIFMNELVRASFDAAEKLELANVEDADHGGVGEQACDDGTPTGAEQFTMARPGSAGSLAESAALGDMRQKLPQTSNNVDSTIRQCLLSNDFKKLEHLILAGCGQRIQGALSELDSESKLSHETMSTENATNNSDSNNNNNIDNGNNKQYRDLSSLVSDEMRSYVRGKATQCMQTIEKIHSQLHECFSVALEKVDPGQLANLSNNQRIASSSSSTTKRDDEMQHQQQSEKFQTNRENFSGSMNSAFHKLCNLMERSCMIVARDRFGASPVHVAIMRADKRLLDYLLRRHPEAASAPDHEGRNALHYAALALAFHQSHATQHHSDSNENREICLTTSQHLKSLAEWSPGNGGGVGPPLAYWPINETTQLIFDHLRARYGPELLDARDRRGRSCQDYLLVGRNSNSNCSRHKTLEQGLHEAAEISECCGDYSRLLKRYDYLIWIQMKAARWQELPKTPEVPPETSDSERINAPQVQSKKIEDPAAAVATTTTTVAAVHTTHLVADSPQKGNTSCLRQLGDLFGERTEPKSPKRRSITNASQFSDLYAHLGPPGNERPSSSRSSQGRRSNNHLSQHHHHNGHPNSFRRRSIVGGVIVPTIIHDDKMDEIETYDIIYRQPPNNSSSRQSSASSSTSSTDVGGFAGHLNNHRQHHHSPAKTRSPNNRTPLRSIPVGRPAEIGSAGEIASGSDSISDEDNDDEEDDRVERLSNEFEDRVRKEKNELRAKVDQIMREIKISAKTGKSTRFLASPNDLSALNDDKEKSDKEQPAKKHVVVPEKSTVKLLIGQQSSSGHGSSKSSSSSSSCNSTSCTQSNCSTAGSSSKNTSISVRSRTGSSSCSEASSSSSTCRSSTAIPPQEPEPAPAQGQSATIQPVAPIKRQDHDPTSQLMILVGQQQVVSKNNYGQTYLHFISSRYQSSSTLYKVLDHASHLIGERDIFYRTARDVALQFNLPNNVQILDKFIIDLFIGSRTTLLWLLLLQGYSPLIHVADPDGNDIMLILKLLKLDRMIQYLLQMADFQRWRDELHTFIRHGYSAGVNELSRKHKDLVRAKSVYSRTSLHLAVLFDRLDMVNELLEIDQTSVHVTDNMGRTPLHYLYGLTMQNGEAIRDKLISVGASLETRDVRMRTPKYYYIFRREIEEIRRIELEVN